ncbi:MAG: hypothetical protein OQJ89_07715 [Kangiellaceae bacterium]|nr:hypothetical protein [Kangiellaceae bacterium]MCW8999807.1 hypothetical protein [Kangiellaceae bacterium]MCW9016833.1 hypothetical protein [Kangiellaceae bacterium]
MSDIFFTIGNMAFAKPQLVHWLALLFVIVALMISCRAALERLSKQNRRKWLLIGLNLIAFIAISGFIFKPLWKSTEGQVVTLITASFSELKDPLKNQPDFLWYKPTNQQVEEFQINPEQIILAPEQLNLRFSKIDKLIVRGDGLNADEWQSINAGKIEYSSPQVIPGFVNPQWRNQVNIGDFFSVSGEVSFSLLSKSSHPEVKSKTDKSTVSKNRLVKSKILKVELIDPAGQVVAANDVLDGEYFELEHRPKLLGNHIYNIELSRLVKNVKEIIATEKIGVSVVKQIGLNLLILQSSPSFETKQLQNWAAENGARILVKSQISKDRFITRKINFDDLKQNDLSRELFEKMDLVLADSRALVLLNSATSETLLEAVKNGLGLMVLADYSQMEKAHTSHWLQDKFNLVNDESHDSAQVYWSNDNAGLRSQSNLFLPRVKAKFNKSSKIQPMAFSSEGEALVSSVELGKGKIAQSLVRETARWVTRGERAIYSHYWQSLIRQISRRAIKIQIDLFGVKSILSENQRVRVCINDIDSSSLSISSSTNVQRILLQASKSNSRSNCGVFWPQAGWSTILHKDEKDNVISHSFYSASTNQWKTQRQYSRMNASLDKVESNSQLATLSKPGFLPISLWWFWWIFISCASLLWIEKKLFDESS